MENIYTFVETQLENAAVYRGDYSMVNTFKLIAFGAWMFYIHQRLNEGISKEELDKLDDEWDNKYRLHFEALAKEAS